MTQSDKIDFIEISADDMMLAIDNNYYFCTAWHRHFSQGTILVTSHVNAWSFFAILEQDWPPEERYYFEAGANNGVSQSNTFQLDHYFGWRGVLVEPVTANFKKCQKYRSAECINAALVSDSFKNKELSGQFSDKVLTDREEQDNGLGAGCTQLHKDEYPDLLKTVPTITITEALIKNNAPKRLGFLSLDVEGHELESLRGLDFNIFRPRLICIEITSDAQEIKNLLENKNYHMLAQIDECNFLYKTNE